MPCMDAANKHDAGVGGVLRPSRICYLVIIATVLWAMVFYMHSAGMQGGTGVMVLPKLFKASGAVSHPSSEHPPSEQPPSAPETNRSSSVVAPPPAEGRCAGRYIYMYDLPPRFNADLLRGCRELSKYTDMCSYLSNCGMGQPLGDEGGAFSGPGWFATDQFALEVISHCRMKRYACLTSDPSLAAAVYVPFYAALDAGRYFFHNTSERDALPLDLADWLVRRPEWQAMGGRDHFMVAGRTSWELERQADVAEGEQWGNNLLGLPAIRNMTALVLETSPWDRGSIGKMQSWSSVAIPYPTYFHPETGADVAAWQERMRKEERKWLFAFAGAPRPGSKKTIRAEIIRQCGASRRCNLFDCNSSGGGCYWPGGATKAFEGADFCLEPRGDTLTRRSTFDAILAGCIPVFFHPGSAYTQYTAHFPRDPNSYSVLILHTDVTGVRNVSIEETLGSISPAAVRAMREEVIRLIPRVVYADPRSTRVDFKDAFDVALEAVFDRVAKRRRS